MARSSSSSETVAPLGSHARHYYDMFHLVGQTEVNAMLSTEKDNYDAISRTHFAQDYFAPNGMSFWRSEAHFLWARFAVTIGHENESQMPIALVL